MGLNQNIPWVIHGLNQGWVYISSQTNIRSLLHVIWMICKIKTVAVVILCSAKLKWTELALERCKLYIDGYIHSVLSNQFQFDYSESVLLTYDTLFNNQDKQDSFIYELGQLETKNMVNIASHLKKRNLATCFFHVIKLSFCCMEVVVSQRGTSTVTLCSQN